MTGGPRPARRPFGSSSRRRVMARPAGAAALLPGATAHPLPPAGPAPDGSLRRWVGPIVIGVLVLLVAVVVLFGQSPGTAPQSPRATIGPTAAGSAGSPAGANASARTVLTSGSSSSPSPGPRQSPRATSAAATPRSTPAPSRDPRAAPRNAAEFDLEEQVIVITFPLREQTRYRYRDTFRDPREGLPDNYNHVRRRDGAVVRGHDGADIYARLGAPVLAPFDGIVIDPSERWRPWEPARYGQTAVIVSAEPNSEGYAALLAHLDRLWVEPGQRVKRGDVIGTVGNTGNAESVEPHVHFELRAPFGLTWLEAGEERTVDAFDPYPSLVKADPKRRL